MGKELERHTRKTRIDTKLRSLDPAWEVVEYSKYLDLDTLHCAAVEELPTESGPADYALFVNGNLLGFIEAKKVSLGAQNVLEQAKRYSRTSKFGPGNWGGFNVPFLYSTNGEKIFFIDVRKNNAYSRQIADFHTPDALQELFDRNLDCSWFKENPPRDKKLRYYQKDAIASAENFIAEGHRNMLLAMATGTGKTFTVVSEIYRLLESKQFKRILFLVDRRALAVQAVRELSTFNTHEGNKFNQEYEVYHQKFRREDLDENQPFDPKVLPEEYLTKPNASKTFVYVSTIQRMTMNLFGRDYVFPRAGDGNDYDHEADKLDIPIHAFDLIIADECHRGYTASETGIWRETLDYFDAVKIGLTATPAVHTLSLFNKVIYRYPTDQAITDGFLVDYEAVKINSNIRMNGAFLKEGEEVGIVDTETGQETLDQLEDERQFQTQDIESKITVPDTNRKICTEIAKYALDHEKEYGQFPKTLIFAQNDKPHTSHADQIVKICRETFGRGDKFVQKITGSPTVDRPLQKIREFRNRPEPRVVVTVDMLSTGVDIPAIEFIVFMRPVKSRILWVQMLGRGTRRCPEINKEKFVIFDCFDGTLFEYFKNATDFNVAAYQKKPLAISEVIENIYENIDRDYYVRVLIKRLRRIERTMSGKAREMFAKYIDDGDITRFADELPQRIKQNFAETMKVLRDNEFQDLLVNYPRAKRTFTIAYDTEDEVSSEAMIHKGADYQRPEDYLTAFSEFVRRNPEQIEAISVLLKKPSEWRTDLLNDLRKKLKRNQFSEEELQKAHNLVHHKAMADIISMVKHAVTDSELLTAEERVDRAIEKVVDGKDLDDEQGKWMTFIRQHLISNLTIDVGDFDEFPVLADRGGISAAKHVFGDELDQLIHELNTMIAA